MVLVTPDLGLIIWNLIVFLLVLIVLRGFVWKPVLNALKAREYQIEDSLKAADNAREEMKQIETDNEQLLHEARTERGVILKKAKEEATHIVEHAKAETLGVTSEMIQSAREAIEVEKKAALMEIKDLVATLSLEIAEKILREKLSDDKSQKALVNSFIKDVKVN